MVKIQFIIVGWHYFEEVIDQFYELVELEQEDVEINIFWACHKKPPLSVSENFHWGAFPNLGLEDGAYQQGLELLEELGYVNEDSILFFMHDDLIIKDWGFITRCVHLLNQQNYKFIGNGTNYPATVNLNELVRGKPYQHWVKPEARNLFDRSMYVLTIRESFLCTKRNYLREIFDFEVIWEEPVPDENGKVHIGGIGNLQQTLLGYKICRVHGPECITYLGREYQKSAYIFECARGSLS